MPPSPLNLPRIHNLTGRAGTWVPPSPLNLHRIHNLTGRAGTWGASIPAYLCPEIATQPGGLVPEVPASPVTLAQKSQLDREGWHLGAGISGKRLIWDLEFNSTGRAGTWDASISGNLGPEIAT